MMETLSPKCRTCCKEGSLNKIFVNADSVERYTTALFLTTGLLIELNDGLPQTICLPCVKLVNLALKLRDMSHDAEKKLIQMGCKRVKMNCKENVNGKRLKNITSLDRNNCTVTDNTLMNIDVESRLENNSETFLKCGKDTEYDILTKDSTLEGKFNIAHQNDSTRALQPEKSKNIKRKTKTKETPKTPATKPTQTKETEQTDASASKENKTSERAQKNKETRQLVMSYVLGDFSPNGPITCKACNTTMSKWETFRNHCKRHMGLGLICEYCGKRFFSMTPLRRHKSSLHGEARVVLCAQCDYRALDRQQLAIHVRREHTKERPYVCELCGSSFFSRVCLLQHLEAHSTRTDVQCPQCPSQFKSRRHLARHSYLSHGRHRYRCALCRREFSRLRCARAHAQRLHGGGAVERVAR